MQIERIDLTLVRLPLVRPFQTSPSRKEHFDHILVRVATADGAVGWGECASPSDPFYCPETCWHILRDFLAPMVLDCNWRTIEELTGLDGPRTQRRDRERIGKNFPVSSGNPLNFILFLS
jgi:O-succinylbenzoate synthase